MRHVQALVAGKTQQMDFGGATDRDSLVHRRHPRRRGRGLKRTLAVVAILIAVGYSGAPIELTKLIAANVTQKVQANVTDRPQVIAPQVQPDLEAQRVRRVAAERERLAVARQSKEQSFERALDEHYLAPEGCDNWKSDRHMVECVNHGMRARAQFMERFYGG